MKHTLSPVLAVIAIAVIAGFLLAGCTQTIKVTPPATPTPTGINNQQGNEAGSNAALVPGTYKATSFDPKTPVTTKAFASDEELVAFLKQYRNSGGSYGYYRGGLLMNAMVKSAAAESVGAPAPAVAPTAADGGAMQQNDYSGTNNQVQNVDEADILKTDGNYIYTVSNGVVYVIDAYPGEDAKTVSTLKFDSEKGYNVQGLFIDGDKLAVFGNYYNNDWFKEMNVRPRSGVTFFNIYDVSDRANPKLVKEYKFEGSYFNARMKKGFVYFVVQSAPEYRIGYHGPMIFEGTVAKSMPAKDIMYYPMPYNSPQFITVHAIYLQDVQKDINSKSVAVEGGEQLYMSENNIYVSYTQYINEYELQQQIVQDLLKDKLTQADTDLIEKIKATDDDVLSKQEKDAKIQEVYQTYINFLSDKEQSELQDKAAAALKEKLKEYDHLEFSVITRIAVDGGVIDVKETGKVPGHLNNQFSMDEYNGSLRVATTLSQRWSYYGSEDPVDSKSSNNVYALDSTMKVIGKLEGMAETEQIFSTRFMGKRLYMVTYRQVDPFFVIDLSDPTNIKEMGKLKVPGFSRYLHPYDENTIIGIGQDANDMGQTKGLKISLFDVTDVANPKETAKFVTDERYAQSTALYEHKAFLFNKDKQLLVIPVYSYSYRPWDSTKPAGSDSSYNGAFVFKITKDTIDLRGLIDHSKAPNVDNSGYGYWYQPLVERSLFINELLYTKSPTLLRINKLSDLSSVKNLTLESSTTSIPVY